jgi:hypothetical protein
MVYSGAKVRELEHTVAVEEQVVRAQVAVRNVLLAEVGQREQDL